MKNKLRAISLLLALFSLAGIASGCGGSSSSGDSTKSPSDSFDTEADTTAAEPISPDLPDIDLGGYAFRAATWSEVNGEGFWTNEQNGDIVNDAVFNALGLVEERFNATMEPVIYADSYNDVNTYVTKNVESGDDTFDLIYGHSGKMWQLSLQGYFRNIREFKYQDFSKPWWPEFANDVYEVNGKQYIFVSYFTYKAVGDASAIFINKNMAEDYGLAVPYDEVRAGTWTLDEFVKMTKTIYSDLDNDGKKSENDMFGFLCWNKMSMQTAFAECYKENSEGLLTLDYNKEQLIDTLEIIRDLISSDSGYVVDSGSPDARIFVSGRSLFYYSMIDLMAKENMRESSFDYGILPVPKYDEAQEQYITPLDIHPFGVPVTAQNTDEISLLLEAYSSVGYNTVREAYFNTALQDKYSRDEDTADMLDIISNTLKVDLAVLNTPAGGTAGLGRIFLYAISKDHMNSGLASYIASIEPSEQKIIDDLNEFFGSGE